MSTSDTKQTMLDAYAALEAGRKQQRALEDRRAELQNQVTRLETEAESAASDLSQALAQFGSGALSDEDVTKVREHKHEADQAHGDARELLDAIVQERPKVAAKQEQLRAEAIRAREAHATAVSDAITERLAGDKKLRRQLLEAFAAIACARDPVLGGPVGQPDWGGVLMATFPEPTDAEFEQIHAEVSAKHFGDLPANKDAAA